MKRLLLAAMLLGLVSPANVDANPWSILGFDGDSIAKGGALTGGAGGPAAVYYNPAGLIKHKTRDVSLSYLHAEPMLRFEQHDNPDLLSFNGYQRLTTDDVGCGDDQGCVREVRRYNNYFSRGQTTYANHQNLRRKIGNNTQNVRRLDGLTIGATMPLAVNPEDAWASAGGAIFLPLGPILYQRIKGPTTPYFLKYDDSPHRIVADAGVAAEFWDVLRVGIGVDILVNVAAQPEITAVLPPELSVGALDPNFQDIRFYADGTVEVPPAFAPTGGIQYSPVEWVDFGVAFRDEQGTDITVESKIEVATPFGTETIPATIAAGGAFTPRQFAAGFAVRPLDQLEVVADVTWKQWSAYTPPFAIEAKVENAGDAACNVIKTFQDLDQILSSLPVTDLNQDTICNLAGGFNSVEINTYDPELNEFSDIFSPAVGLSYTSQSFDVSGGYRFEPTPVPDQLSIYNILDSDTHIFSTGFTYKWLSWLSIGAYGQYRYLTERTIEKRVRDGEIREQTNSADAFPDISYTSTAAQNNDEMSQLASDVQGTQYVFPCYGGNAERPGSQPGCTIGGGYLTAGVQIDITF